MARKEYIGIFFAGLSLLSTPIFATPPPLPPKLCSRVQTQNVPNTFFYNGLLDPLNHQPKGQLLDPDYGQENQYQTIAQFDGKNVLLLKKVKITYDYEDTKIIDYSGPHPITKQPYTVYEGDGGFYANFHYAIVPFDKDILEMDSQTILHLAQGKLKEIHKARMTPKLRTHSFIPGPFLSRIGYLYEMCEWGDTDQFPIQEMNYSQIALWDWDYDVKKADHVILIIWEGDEEDWLIHNQLIDPFYLTDDLIGVFEIKKEETKNPLTLKNQKGDFEMMVQTGDF